MTDLALKKLGLGVVQTAVSDLRLKSWRNGAKLFLLEDMELFPFWCQCAGLDWREVRRRMKLRLEKPK